jgi:hypothetical protein
MRDLRKYWHDINALEKELPDFVWLMPVTGAGGLVEVKGGVAAKLLHAGSHRMATDEEKDHYQDGQQVQRRRAFHDDLRRKGIAVVPVSSGEYDS